MGTLIRTNRKQFSFIQEIYYITHTEGNYVYYTQRVACKVQKYVCQKIFIKKRT